MLILDSTHYFQPRTDALVTVYSSGEQFLCISLCAWNTNNPVHVFHLQV